MERKIAVSYVGREQALRVGRQEAGYVGREQPLSVGQARSWLCWKRTALRVRQAGSWLCWKRTAPKRWTGRKLVMLEENSPYTLDRQEAGR